MLRQITLKLTDTSCKEIWLPFRNLLAHFPNCECYEKRVIILNLTFKLFIFYTCHCKLILETFTWTFCSAILTSYSFSFLLIDFPNDVKEILQGFYYYFHLYFNSNFYLNFPRELLIFIEDNFAHVLPCPRFSKRLSKTSPFVSKRCAFTLFWVKIEEK